MTTPIPTLNPVTLEALDRQAAILESQAEATIFSLRDLAVELRTLRLQLEYIYQARTAAPPALEYATKEVPHAEAPLETAPGRDRPVPGGPEVTPEPGPPAPPRKRSTRRHRPAPAEPPPVAPG